MLGSKPKFHIGVLILLTMMLPEERLEIVLREVEEVVTRDELMVLLENKPSPTAYIGIEPSGLMHIGQGMLTSRKIRDMQEAGFKVKILLADWHAYINDKFGGSMEDIKLCGAYIRDCFLAMGVDPSKTEFIWASDMMDDMGYWERVLRVSKANSVARIRRAVDIMGREEEDADADSSKLIYPSLQVADIFELEVDVAYAGMDQRRAHMLARDTADKLGWNKPVAIHTPILTGLKGSGRMDAANKGKMSKSDPDSCIFIHDTPEDIKRKVNGAYCPPTSEDNPVLDMCRYLIFPETGEFIIPRDEKWGGPLKYETYELLTIDHVKGDLHPMDLKNAVSKYLTDLLEPVRQYFAENPDNYQQLMELF